MFVSIQNWPLGTIIYRKRISTVWKEQNHYRGFFVHTTELAVGTIWSVWRGVCESVSVVDGAFVSLIAWVYTELHLNSLKKRKNQT